jgi:hypothetical protein
MKSTYALMLLVVLFGLPACRKDKKPHVVKETITTEKRVKKMALADVNIPLDGQLVAMNDSNEDLDTFFDDEDLSPTMEHDNEVNSDNELTPILPDEEASELLPLTEETQEFTWVDAAQDNNLK